MPYLETLSGVRVHVAAEKVEARLASGQYVKPDQGGAAPKKSRARRTKAVVAPEPKQDADAESAE